MEPSRTSTTKHCPSKGWGELTAIPAYPWNNDKEALGALLAEDAEDPSYPCPYMSHGQAEPESNDHRNFGLVPSANHLKLSSAGGTAAGISKMLGQSELLDHLGSWDTSESALSLLNSSKAQEKSLPLHYKILLQTLRILSNARNVSEKPRVKQFLRMVVPLAEVSTKLSLKIC